MNTRRSITAGFLFLVFSCLCTASDPNACSSASSVADPCLPEPTIQRWMVWNYWQMLQAGMSSENVVAMLGEPLARESTETACVWYYQQAPQKLESGVIQRPHFGLLTFKISALGGKETMVLRTWRTPNWNEVRGYSAVQFEIQQKQIADVQQQERRRQAELEKQRQLEAEQKKQEALRQQQLEQERQMRAQQEAAERNKGFSLDKIPRTYLYAAGGVLVGIIVAAVILKKPFSG